jgi:hypothetical protein
MSCMSKALFVVGFSLLVAGCAGAPAAAVPGDGGVEAGLDAGETPDAGPAQVAPEGLVRQVAASSCGALFRCCDGASRQRYFASYQANLRLASLAGRFPPADEASCAALLEEALPIVPLGGWLSAVDAGLVAYDGAAAAACLQALDTAACGAPMREALFDGRCFGFNPPQGGGEQRAMFQRTAVDGAPCRALNDGIGGGFYGTCNPAEAFCCYERPGSPGCALSNDAGTGTCRAVSAEGEACGVSPLQLCATGVDCNPATGTCASSPDAALGNGQPCADGSFNLLGDCAQGWCDLFGTRTCEPRKADGAACFGPDECAGGDCVLGRCAVNSVCVAP